MSMFRPVDLRPTDMNAGLVAGAGDGVGATFFGATTEAGLGAVEAVGRVLDMVVDTFASAGSTPPCRLRGCLHAVHIPSSGIPSSRNSIRVNKHLQPGAEQVLDWMHTMDLSAKLSDSIDGTDCVLLLTAGEGVEVFGVAAVLGVGRSAEVLYREVDEVVEVSFGIGAATGSMMEYVAGADSSTGAALTVFVLLIKLVNLFFGTATAATGVGTGRGADTGALVEGADTLLSELICLPTPANLAALNCSPIVDI